jgi:hypothetical protein
MAVASEDARAAVWLNDVHGADFFRLKSQAAAGASTFTLRKVSGFRVLASRGVKDMELDGIDSTSY